MRAAIYTRVSSEEQVDGYSLSAQEEQGRRFAEANGWRVTTVYSDEGRSGKNVLRPEFQQMMRDAQSHQFDVLIVHKLDRFSRSLVDVMTHLKLLHNWGVTFVSITERMDYTTVPGKLMLGVIALLAEGYLDNLSLETTKGKAERSRKGEWNGTLPFGYTTLARLRHMLTSLGEEFRSGLLDRVNYIR